MRRGMEWELVRDDNGKIVTAESYFNKEDRKWAKATRELEALIRKEPISDDEEELTSPSEDIELSEEVTEGVTNDVESAVTDRSTDTGAGDDWMKSGGTLKTVKAAVVTLERLGLSGDLTVAPPHAPANLSDSEKDAFSLSFAEILRAGLEEVNVIPVADSDADSDDDRLIIDESVDSESELGKAGPSKGKKRSLGSSDRRVEKRKSSSAAGEQLTVDQSVQTDLSSVTLFGERLKGFNFLFGQIKSKLSEKEIKELKFPSLSVGESVSASKKKIWEEVDVEEEILISTKSISVRSQTKDNAEQRTEKD